MGTHFVPLSKNPQGVLIEGVLWTLIVLSGSCLGLRIYCKFLRRRRLWWDDYFIIMAWIMLLISCIATTNNVGLGFGMHFVDVPVENLIPMGLVANISGFTSVLGVALSKTSFAITLLRLTDGWLKWFVWFIIITLNATQHASAVFFWVSCDPPAKTWNPTLEGTCWSPKIMSILPWVIGGWSAFCDFALAFLPWRLLFRFHMYRREKVGIAIAMSMGVFAGITCIIKLTTIPPSSDRDFTYNGMQLVIWGFAEVASTIIATCIPTMRALFVHRTSTSQLPSLQLNVADKGAVAFSSNRPAPIPDHERRDNMSDRSILGLAENLGSSSLGSASPKTGGMLNEKRQSNINQRVMYEMSSLGNEER
ncbi:hypothetical protein B0T25DRAFT_33881 [Lasiosphaeria hispida]|uniref:Rhodopsin domain-containing protein n=1 Tax=Lasiosphaeria hispida TaxID=260671 RepID=A0AAJ0HV89_9PEZI|nr:hypothetical protein B0T25DRAFT_33881 [Lasiosphaeria hispida]